MNSNQKIVLDIVLLLPQNIKSLAGEISKSSNTEKYVSFSDGYNPHISLFMLHTYKNNISEINLKIKKIISDYQPLNLKLNGFHEGKPGWLAIEKNQILSNLHKKIADSLKMYNVFPVVRTSFFKSEQIKEDGSLMSYVERFATDLSYENYDPHISVGKEVNFDGEISKDNFTVDTLGVFHLGNHGTCKEKLEEFKLL